MDLWYKKLGFYSNPFSIKPSAFSDDIFGYDIDGILDKINEGNVILIEGSYGKGKTSILKNIIHRFGGKKKLIYYSCNRAEDRLEINKLITNRNFFAKIFKTKPKDLILLLDEIQDLHHEDSEILANLHQKNFKSIVMVTSSYKMVNFTNGLKEKIGNNIIYLNDISEEDAIKLIRKRIGDISLLSNDIIKEIVKKSRYNPREILKNCETVCRYVIDNNKDNVTSKDISSILK